MKKYFSYILAIMVIALFTLSSCTSMKFENYSFTDPSVLFQSDFSELPDEVNLDHNIRLVDGEIYSLAPKGAGTGWSLNVPFGDGTSVSFRIKLGEKINPPHPGSHINFLSSGPGRLCINIDQSGIGSFWQIGENFFGGGKRTEKSIKTDEWYDVKFLLYERSIVMFLNGSKVKTVQINKDLPYVGNLTFECHNEMWIDDLVVTKFTDYEVVKK